MIKAVSERQAPTSSALTMTTDTSIDVMAQFGILEPHEVAELLKPRHSTVLDLSRRGVLPAFKIGKHWRYRRADLEEWMVRRRDDR
jgi:excisionase family DNA binding protein